MAEFVNPHEVTVTEKKTDPEKHLYFTGNICDENILDIDPNRRRRSPIMLQFQNDRNVSVVDIIRAMEGGMNIMKFKMAYTTIEEKIKLLHKIDNAAAYCAEKKGDSFWPTATAISCKTHHKKIGILKRTSMDSLQLTKGSVVCMTRDQSVMDCCTERKIYIDYPNLCLDCKVGMEISIGHGEVIMRCDQILDSNSILCEVIKAGVIKSMDTVSIRGMKHTAPFLTSVDYKILKFALKYQVDILTIYYVGDVKNVKKIKRIMSKAKIKPLIFSAICNQEGLDNIDDILQESDGIIFCRDFLQYELVKARANQLVKLQKFVAGKCKQAGIPVFISGILEDAFDSSKLSDTHVLDVSNAIMDGYTGFHIKVNVNMEHVKTIMDHLNAICCQIEPMTFDKNYFWRILQEPKMPVNAAEAAAISCVAVANQLRSRVIIIATASGETARTLLWLQPACIVITVCTRPHVARSLYTCRNIVPLLSLGTTNPKEKKLLRSDDSLILYGAQYAVKRMWLKNGDHYVSLQKSSDVQLFCDMVKIRVVDFYQKVLVECDYPEYPERQPSLEEGEEEEDENKEVTVKKSESVPFIPGF